MRTIFDNAGLTQEPRDARKPHHLFGRLVELDGLAASRRKRPMAASGLALGVVEHRPRQLRQLSAADRLDDGNGGVDATVNWSRPVPVRVLAASVSDDDRARPVGRADDLFDALPQRPTSRAANISTGSTTTGTTTAAASIRTGPVSKFRVCEGDRLAQARNAYSANQEILANKQLRWWWNNPHQAVYDAGVGLGSARAANRVGRAVEVDRHARIRLLGRRQGDQSAERLLRRQVESKARPPYWSIWDSAAGGSATCRGATTRSPRSRSQAVYDYWNDGRQQRDVGRRPRRCCNGRSPASGIGTRGRFPTFPIDNATWGDTGNWQAGDWTNGLRTVARAAGADAAADARDLSELPGALGSRLVGARQAEILDARRRSCLGPVLAGGCNARALITTSN